MDVRRVPDGWVSTKDYGGSAESINCLQRQVVVVQVRRTPPLFSSAKDDVRSCIILTTIVQ